MPPDLASHARLMELALQAEIAAGPETSPRHKDSGSGDGLSERKQGATGSNHGRMIPDRRRRQRCKAFVAGAARHGGSDGIF
jgi:hypothetical protein